MRGLSKKMLISILTSVVVFVTMIATTFAWVGIFTYASTEQFSLNLKVQDLDSNYFLTISSTGKKDSFSNEVQLIDMQRQILKNRGYDLKDKEDDSSYINYLYEYGKIMNPSTAYIDDNSSLYFKKINLDNTGGFEMLDTTRDFLKFDIYLSVNTKEGISEATTDIKSNVYLNEIGKALEGVYKKYSFYNGNPFTELPSSSTNDILKNMPLSFRLNNKNACRFALSIYDPISVDDEYTDDSLPIETKIYQGGTKNPSYDDATDSYNLGGCLLEDYNAALKELLYIRPNYKAYEGTLLREQYENAINYAANRNDLELLDENNVVWNKHDHTSYLGCMEGNQTKMKISVYIWFEGWDADCLKAIDMSSITLNLSFTSGTDD